MCSPERLGAYQRFYAQARRIGIRHKRLIFKLQQVLKFNDSWSFPKTDLMTIFLNSEKGNFVKVSW